ncbi:hypothetical protein HED42_07105 [Enterococcus casseliflavus]|uniref:phage tail spike protein n=1 Tax=Enterococcus casseliflavus TaxID=37734 RepID=UPI0014329263|nr:phage tail spike protein [Enterococcus casseliflavus]NKD37899.1 hypothetical protein [Enterococcus casseliflavus]
MANFYITDRKYNLIDIVSTDGNTDIVVTAIKDTQSIEESVRDFEATLYFEDDDFKLAKKMTAIGNFVLYKDREGQSVFITIESREINATDGLVTLSGKDASVDLINEVVAPYTPDKSYSIAEYILRFTSDSGFEIGENAIPDKKLKLEEWTSEATALERILSVATRFDVELSFSFEISGLDVIKRYINISEKRGKDENVTLYANREIESITIKEDSFDLFTAIKPIGAIPEGKETPINLNSYKYTDPDGRYVLSGGILKDNKVVQEWSRLLSNENTNPTTAHITRYKEYDTDNQAKLFTMAMTDLKKYAQLNVNYDVAFYEFPTTVSIGDTINIVDEDKEIYLSARVLTLTYDYVTDTAEAVVGDYLIKDSGISQDLENLAASMKDKFANVNENLNGKAVIVKSDTAPEPNENTIWIDTSNPQTPIKTYNPETGEWLVSTGEKGKDGIAGKDGVGLKETVIRYAGSSNGTTAPTSGWQSTVPVVSSGNFLWTRTTWTYTDNTSEVGYSVSRIGADGNNGEDGIAGKDGTGIKSTTITYVGSTSGTTKPTSGWTSTIPTVADGNYLWTKTVWLYTDNTSETGYSVAKMGANGADGKDGIAGKDGVGLKNTVIQYAGSTSGTTAPTTGWQTNVPTVSAGNYLWTKNTWTYTDNTTEVGYSVSRIGKDGNTGSDGVAGKDGVGIKATSIQYAGSTSGTTPPTTGWTASVPTVASGSYLWTKTTWSYTDDTNETGYSVSRMGETGAKGDTGDSATSYWVTPSVNAIKKSATKVLSPNTVTFTSYSKTGTANAGLYAGRFNVLTSVDGIVYSSKYSSSANQSSYTYTVPADVRFVKVRMYLAGGTTSLLDEQTIPILDDAEGLEIGSRNYFSVKAWNSKPNLTASAVPYMDIQLEPNTQYTLSTNIPIQTNGQYDVFFFKGTDAPSSASNGVAKDLPRTITTNSDGIVKVSMRSYNLANGYWIMLAKGNKSLDWQPAIEDDMLFTAYSNSADGTVDFTKKYPNKNLFTMKNFTYGQYISWTGDGLTVNNTRGASDYIPVEVGKQYSFSFGVNSQFAVFLYKEYGDVKSDLRLNVGGTAWETPDGIGNASYVSNPTPAIPSGYKYMRVSVLRGSADFTSELLRSLKIKIEEGLEKTAYVMSVQDDEGKSEMGYIGYSPIDSNKSSDYIWTVNPKAQRIFTAYSNSPDGIKDFTRNYPNENLLVKRAITGGNNLGLLLPFHPLSYIGGSSNSKLNLTVLPNNGFKAVVTDTVDPYFRPVNDVLASDYKVPQIGLSFKYQVSDGARIRVRLIGFNGSGTNSTTYYTGSGQVNEIINVVSSTNKTYISIDILDATASAGKVGSEATITELKVSNGNALPFTTSPKDDAVKAEMPYIGYSAKDSDNPNDYTWSENPKARGTFIAYANSSDGKKDFTQFYPKENLLLNGRVMNTISNNNNLYPSTFEYLIEDKQQFVRTKRSDPTSNPTTFSIYTAINIGSALATSLVGKKVGISVEARASSEVSMTLMARYVGGATGTFAGDSRVDTITTEWKQVKLVVDSYPTGATTIRFNPLAVTGTVPNLSTFYLDMRNWKIEILDPEQTEATPYTTPPKEDPIMAEMKYIGYSAKQSTNPADYAWSENPKAKGTFKRWANSPDGKVDFTDTYPNLNELPNSRSPKVNTYQGTNIVITEDVAVPEWGATDAVKHVISGGTNATVAGTLATGLLVDRTAKYVHSIYIKNVGTDYIRINNNLGRAIDVYAGETKKVVFAPSQNATADAAKQFVIYRANVNAVQEFIIWHAKIEKSDTVETIWTSTPDEDLLGSMPQYIGIGNKDSDNPADYVWTVSPEYTQARTDLGLESKVDDETFNDAQDHMNEMIDSKASADELQALAELTENLKESYEGFISDGGKYEADLQALEARATGLLLDLEDKVLDLDFLKTRMRLGEEGFEIGAEESSMKMLLTNDRLSFMDSGKEIAYFSNQQFKINRGAILESIQIGSHKITKISDKMTVFQFVPPL